MDRLRKMLKMLLFPRLWVVLVSVVVSAAALVFIFSTGSDESPAAYAGYLHSAYALTVAVLWIVKTSGRAKERIVDTISTRPLLHRFFTDTVFCFQTLLHQPFKFQFTCLLY